MSQKKAKSLARIADALDRLAPPAPQLPDFQSDAYIWHENARQFDAVANLQFVPLDILVGLDRSRDLLYENSLAFAKGQAANNALLWGARGMGKSSLIKSVYAALKDEYPITLVEVLRDDLERLGDLMRLFRKADRQIIIFCDDLSFEYEESVYKSLKAALDGGVAGVPRNVVFYATSNRRHLMAREMIENERQAAIHDKEAIEEKISLSDRFGLWLGFHSCDQDAYFEMIRRYVELYKLDIAEDDWRAQAVEWSVTRGARSGRVAEQFVKSLRAGIA